MAALPASGICGQIGPSAGTWKTWVTPAVSQIRFAALPNAATSVAENPTMKRLMAEATADTSAQGAYRAAGAFRVDREPRGLESARMDASPENGRDLE